MEKSRSLKILMVNKFLHPKGGSETYMIQLGNELEKQGHEVEYFGMDDGQRTVGNHANCYTSSMDFHTHRIGRYMYPMKILYSREARKKIACVLKNFSPDIVHLNNFNFQITPSILYEIKKYAKEQTQNIRIVLTAHDYQLICPNHMLYNHGKPCECCKTGEFQHCIKGKCIHQSFIKSLIGSLEGWLYKWLNAYQMIDYIICPSHFLESRIKEYRGLAEKTVVLHNFVSAPSTFEIEKKGYVLYFGRYSQEKGIKNLVQICKQNPSIPFVFAGAGELEYLLQNIDNIKNVGFKTGVELQRLIREACFTVFPSEWYENCPYTVLESIVSGTPVLASSMGGTGELIRNDKTGLLFMGGNSKDLEQKLRSMYFGEKYKKYAINCNSKQFDMVEDYVKKLMKVYKSGIDTDIESNRLERQI